MLSSKSDAKQEDRFAARLDVLLERVDTLASTVATTASAIAKKDGEIAALQRALEARDQTLQGLAQQVSRAAESAASADVPVDATELRSLRNAVAALTKERAGGVNAAQVQSLVAAMRALDERVGALAAAAAAPPVPTTDPATTARLDVLAAELAAVRTALDRAPDDLTAILTPLRDQVDGLAEARSVTEEQLEQRVGETSDALATQSERLDALARTLEELDRRHAVDESQVERRLGETDAALERVSHRLETLGAEAPRVDALAQRIGGLERTRDAGDEQLDRRLRTQDDGLAKLSHRLDVLAEGLSSFEGTRIDHEERLDHRFGRTSDALAALSQRLDALQAVDEEHVARRLGATDDALATLAERQDTLAAAVESARADLGDKERELATLHRHFTESSTRIESIVDDIREALHAFPELSSTSIDDLGARLERIETATRQATDTNARAAGDLSGRIDAIDHRVATVAEEVSRAKTLWPVALRSLEARLDDAVHARRQEAEMAPATDAPADDLLAGLRDSLQEMEAVAAEMTRASETLSPRPDQHELDGYRSPTAETGEAEMLAEEPAAKAPQTGEESPAAAAAGGATVVPLRTGEP